MAVADTLRTIDLPTHLMLPQENSFFLKSVGESFTGAFNPRPRSGGARYRRWICSLTLNTLGLDEDRDLRFEWEAFIHSLDGTATCLRIFDVTRRLPRGVAAGFYAGQQDRTEYFRTSGSSAWSQTTGSARVGGAGFCLLQADAARNADAIVLSGLTANATVFKPGDLLEIGGNLHEVRVEAVSDASGHSAVQLNNRLWKPALAGDMVNLVDPKGRFVLMDAEQGKARRSGVLSSTSIEAIEVPYVE